jgi:hypothetical protein
MKKLSTLVILIAALVFLPGARLPAQGPKPQLRPDISKDATPSTIEEKPVEPEAVPTPEPRPEEPKPDAAKQGPATPEPPEPGSTSPAVEKAGPPKPADTPAPDLLEEAPKAPGEETLEEQHLTIEPENDSDHAQCLKELQSFGTVFKEVPRIDDGNGCGIDKPIVVSEALPGIDLKPDATLRCPTALALAHWMKETVIPAASVAAGDQGSIKTINQASAYICRLRNSAETGKISEHARGNAIDVASFSFEKGKDIAVQPRREDSTLIGAFQRAVSAAACLYFNTVLDPESDAAHETHFHLDVLQRKGGYRYCH